MKYPYIGQCYSAMILFYAEGEGLVLDDALGLDENIKVGDKVTLNDGANITHEYLQNTYGEVVSPEHAEFIIKLAELHGFEFGGANLESENAKSFMIYEDSFDIYPLDAKELSNEEGRRKITIPLPPKQIQTATPEEDFEMTQIEKNNGGNLMFGGADKCEEWPKVGDEVICNGVNYYYLCKSPFSDAAVLTLCSSDDWDVISAPYSDLKKPKTPEDDLFDIFWGEVALFMNRGNLDENSFKHAFLRSVNKKPQ